MAPDSVLVAKNATSQEKLQGEQVRDACNSGSS